MSSCSNKKSFFGYVNRKLRSRKNLPPLKDNNNGIVMDPEKKAELLNSQFSTFFTEDDGGLPTIQSNFFSFLPQMRHIEINPTVIKNAIDKIKNSSSKTPDDIPSVFIKNCYTSLLVPLSILFNMILQTGKILTSGGKL